MKKKFLSVLLAVVMIVSVPFTASAFDEATSEEKIDAAEDSEWIVEQEDNNNVMEYENDVAGISEMDPHYLEITESEAELLPDEMSAVDDESADISEARPEFLECNRTISGSNNYGSSWDMIVEALIYEGFIFGVVWGEYNHGFLGIGRNVCTKLLSGQNGLNKQTGITSSSTSWSNVTAVANITHPNTPVVSLSNNSATFRAWTMIV